MQVKNDLRCLRQINVSLILEGCELRFKIRTFIHKRQHHRYRSPPFGFTSFYCKWIFFSKTYDKCDDFDFGIVNFPFLDGDVPRRASYGVYISQLIRFARVSNHVTYFNTRNKYLTAKFLQQDYRYHILRKAFSEVYRRHYSNLNAGLKALLRDGLSEPEFYGDLVYKFKKLIGRNDFSFQFRNILCVTNVNVMRQSACLVFSPVMVDNYAAFFNCTPVGRASDSMMAPT